MAKQVLTTTGSQELDVVEERARQEIARRVREATVSAIALALGIGAGLSLSIVFLGSGVLVAALVVPIGLTGTAAYFLLPPLIVHHRRKGK